MRFGFKVEEVRRTRIECDMLVAAEKSHKESLGLLSMREQELQRVDGEQWAIIAEALRRCGVPVHTGFGLDKRLDTEERLDTYLTSVNMRIDRRSIPVISESTGPRVLAYRSSPPRSPPLSPTPPRAERERPPKPPRSSRAERAPALSLVLPRPKSRSAKADISSIAPIVPTSSVTESDVSDPSSVSGGNVDRQLPPSSVSISPTSSVTESDVSDPSCFRW